ncbi:Uncharacterised protein [uncultured archaeon]|nr:Uncharacterised protein [uncultured archaeon]
MKIQTSLEFLLITSAIAALCLCALTAYGMNLSVQKNILSAASNVTVLNSTAFAQPEGLADPHVQVYVPAEVTTDANADAQVIAYGCPYGILNVTLNSSSLSFSKNDYSARVYGVSLFNFPFVALAQGFHDLEVKYRMSCENVTVSGSDNFSAYSSPSFGSPISYSALLTDRREFLAYPLEPPEPVPNLSQSNHCTWVSFWGNPLSVQTQCGTDNAWDYRTFSDYCYFTLGVATTSTYCILPSPTGYNITAVGNRAAYVYAFTFQLYSRYGIMRAVIAGPGPANLSLNGKTVGTVSVTSVQSSSVFGGMAAIGKGGAYFAANETAYGQYAQAKNSLYGTLGYYNSTEVDLSLRSSIQQAIYAFNRASTNLISRSTGSLGCNISTGNYVCDAPAPFTYVVDVSVSRDIVPQNQTLSYLGSQINIFSA